MSDVRGIHPESNPRPESPVPGAPAPAPPEAPAERPDIAPEPGLPGAHRGGFLRLPTAPLDITVESAPDEPGTVYDTPVSWGATTPLPARRGVAAWALVASIVGLVVSLFVGWGFPLGIVGVVTAVVALRRPFESRGVAAWAIVLGILSIFYSAGWLLYAASRANLFS